MSRTSLANRIVCGYLRLVVKRSFSNPDGGEQMLARPKGPSEPPAKFADRHPCRTNSVAGRDVHVVEPVGGARTDAGVVYLHGGSYVNEIVKQHWALIADIAETTGAAVQVPIYPLAPGATLPEMVDFVAEVVRGLGDVAVQLAGDSAGGGLALLVAQRLRDEGTSPVRSVTVMAPWLDLAMANPGIDAIEPTDPWLARPALRRVAAAVAGDLSVEDPAVSPIRGDLSGLPPITAYVGTRDITLADCRLLRESVEAAGGEIAVHEAAGSPHVHLLLPTPEGRAARRSMLDVLAGHIGGRDT